MYISNIKHFLDKEGNIDKEMRQSGRIHRMAQQQHLQ
jgi:hypothetical protein